MNPIIDAIVVEVGGAFYRVRLHAIPRVGEFIDLFSFVDMHANHPQPKKYYEVVRVEHELHDVDPNIPQATNGSHAVKVTVKTASKPS